MRAAARDQLNRARSQLKTAGDAAASTVGAATDKAPKKPGFWSKVGHFFGGVGDDVKIAGEHVVNGVASFGNAMANHPGDVLTAAGGIALTGISAGGDGLGVVLDADSTLRFPDFRAEERTFALVAQLAGRSGRGERCRRD